jgi:hypothetical protein
MDDHYLRKSIQMRRCGMNVERSEHATEPDLIFGSQSLLIAEKQHQVPQKCLSDIGPLRLGQRQRQVDAAHLSADCRRHGTDFDARIGSGFDRSPGD